MVTWYGELLLFLSACVHATHAMGTIRPNTSRQVASFKGNDRFGPNVNLILLNRLYDFFKANIQSQPLSGSSLIGFRSMTTILKTTEWLYFTEMKN